MEYYSLGLILKMEGERPGGTGPSRPGVQGGIGGTPGSSSTSLPITVDNSQLDKLDFLLKQLNGQIKQGLGPSQHESAENLKKNLDRLAA